MPWPPRWWPWRPLPTPPTPTPIPTPTPSPTPIPSGIPQQLLDAHNLERKKNGKPPLRINLALQAFSQAHADTMARNGIMSHDTAGDGSFGSRINKLGYSYSNAGENVAWNQQSVVQVMVSWMNSSGHRANILGNFTECGLAVAYGKNNDPYWSTVFCQPGR